MKTLFKMTILVVLICCLTSSCSKHVEPESIVGSQTGTAYVVNDSDITIISVKIIGHFDYDESFVCYDKLEKSFANQAFRLGIVKPGLDFSLNCMAWGTSYNNMIHKANAFHNAIYIERGGIINSVNNLYINDYDKGNLINYRIIDRILYTKQLTPVEKADLNKSIKKLIDEWAIFIY